MYSHARGFPRMSNMEFMLLVMVNEAAFRCQCSFLTGRISCVKSKVVEIRVFLIPTEDYKPKTLGSACSLVHAGRKSVPGERGQFLTLH